MREKKGKGQIWQAGLRVVERLRVAGEMDSADLELEIEIGYVLATFRMEGERKEGWEWVALESRRLARELGNRIEARLALLGGSLEGTGMVSRIAEEGELESEGGYALLQASWERELCDLGEETMLKVLRGCEKLVEAGCSELGWTPAAVSVVGKGQLEGMGSSGEAAMEIGKLRSLEEGIEMGERLPVGKAGSPRRGSL